MEGSSCSSDSEDKEQCCGSGCNNCVLDKNKYSESKTSTKKTNILNSNYTKFIVQNIEECSANTSRYTFKYKHDELSDIEETKLDLTNLTLEIPPGYHLMIRVPYEDIGFNNNTYLKNLKKQDQNTTEDFISRRYTPILVDAKTLTFDVLVKFEKLGLISTYFKHLTIGVCTEWKGSYGTFQWIPNKYKYLLCFCHGVAIAPIYRIINTILNNEIDDTLIQLHVGFQNFESILLRNELIGFKDYWNFQSIIYLTQTQNLCECLISSMRRPSQQIQPQFHCNCIRKKCKYNENICTYRLDNNIIENIYKSLFVYYNKTIINEHEIFTLICGTKDFTNIIENCLKQLNINNYFIF